MEAWVGRESAAFRLPPSRLALDPCDVILLDHDGRLTEMRLVSIADSDLRSIDAVRQDRAVYDLPPGEPRPATLMTPTVFGAPEAMLMDLPQLTEDKPAHRLFIAAHAVPWPGEIAVYRSAATDGFALLTTFGGRARIGTLVSDFFAGPTSRFDLGNALVIDLFSGMLESVTDLTLLGGANALALETASGVWEIVQAGAADLIAPGRYQLTRLLRGQRGTEAALANPAPAGCRGIGALARRHDLSATRPMWGRHSRLRAWGCGRFRSPMSSSHGARLARPAIRPSAGRGEAARFPPTAGERRKCRSLKKPRPTKSRSSMALR